jgi:polyhydroxyalkanoate synthesis regulator phasin|tara:strand:- start:31 stop:279 length:249 start_codon:yes stop_codon:yes gene_type:complete
MKNSKFIIEKMSKLIEQGLISSKDITEELMSILKSKRDEVIFRMKITSKDEFEILSKRVENLEKKLEQIKNKKKKIKRVRKS